MKQRKDGLISVFCKEIEKFQKLISEVIKFNTIAQKGKKLCFESNLQFDSFAEKTSANNRKLIAQLLACKDKGAEFEYLNKEYTVEKGRKVADFELEYGKSCRFYPQRHHGSGCGGDAGK